jgi:hypothetical protein
MPSLVLGFVAGSGFTPLISGNFFSGTPREPYGGCQIRADRNNSGNIFISLSGAFVFSGQVGLLPASGGPTITSGCMPLSGGISSGIMDGMQIGPGDAYFIPKLAFPISGYYGICAGCDLACSGQARIYIEMV